MQEFSISGLLSPSALAWVLFMSYYDVVNFVDSIICSVIVTSGHKDDKTPPDCVYAAYNIIRSEKKIHNYPAGRHTQ